MNELYRVLETTKQNVHQWVRRQQSKEVHQEQLCELTSQLRVDHPRMGGKNLYKKINPSFMGRDRFLGWYRESGFMLAPKRNFRRTTDSSGVIRFPNLMEGLELTHVNQAWVSDITYYELNGKFAYLTLIMDAYSRKIKGYQVSKTLRAEDTTVPALRMALKCLPKGAKPIFHSDGGGQYYCKQFIALTHKQFQNSMGKTAYENPKAERLNRTIKNDYLYGYHPVTFKELENKAAKAVKMYNQEKPHQSLGGLTPDHFERNQILTKTNLKTVNSI